ncbi:MAG: uroporphyrinogen decarboxylase family protein [Candidatus Hodarchaeota archaeon]
MVDEPITLRDLANQRSRFKKNIVILLISIEAILKAFNIYKFKGEKEKYHSEKVMRSDFKLQVEILEWIYGELESLDVSIPIISSFMDLNSLAQSVALVNGKGIVIKNFPTGETAIKSFFNHDLILNNQMKYPILEKDKILFQNEIFVKLVRSSPILSDKLLMGFIPGPASLLAQLISPEKMLLLSVKNRQEHTRNSILKKWIDYTTECSKILAKYLLKLGFEVFCILEPNAIYLDNARFQNYLLNPLNNLIKLIKTNNCPVIFHVCGNSTMLFNSFAKLKEVDAFSLDEEVSLKQLSKLIRDKILIGNSNNKALFLDDEREIFHKSILMQLVNRDLEKEGRYIPGPGCEITFLDENPNKALLKLKALLKGYDPKLRDYVFQYIDENFLNKVKE